MKQNGVLVISSLLTMLLATFHLTDDFVRGFDKPTLGVINVIIVLAVWLYATLVLLDRRSGSIIVLVFSLLASGVPVIHMMGRKGLTAGIQGVGGFFFTWTLLALGATAAFSVLLSARGLWSLRRAHKDRSLA